MSGAASGALLRAALDYLLNCAWQAPLVALAALALATATRASLRGRCVAFAGALVVLGLAPLVPVHRLSALAPAASKVSVTVGRSSGAVAASPVPHVGALAAEALVGAAGLAIAFAAIRLAAGWMVARKLVRRSTALRLPEAAALAMRAFLAGSGRGVPPVRTCDGVAGPAVVGAWSPVVLVPPGFEALPTEQLVAALLHECAHVARRDYAWNLLCETLALPSSWHPAAVLLKRRLRAAREAACDQLAATALGSPARYARCLVELARTVEDGARLSSPALQLLGRGELEDRVRQLTGPTSRAARLPPLQTAGAVALALGCLAPLACLHLTPVLRDGEPGPEVARVAVFDRTAHSSPGPSAAARLETRPSQGRGPRTSTHRAAVAHIHARRAVQLASASPAAATPASATPASVTPAPGAPPSVTPASPMLASAKPGQPVATSPAAAPSLLALARLDEAGDIGRIVFAVEVRAASPCLAAPAPIRTASAAQDAAPTSADGGDGSDFDPFAPPARAPEAAAPAPTPAPTAPAATAKPTCLKAAAFQPVRRRGLA